MEIQQEFDSRTNLGKITLITQITETKAVFFVDQIDMLGIYEWKEKKVL